MATTGRRLASFDGTTGRSDHGGRRTHVIQVLRDSLVPVSVQDIAEQVGMPATTARFHLEALADAGMAERVRQVRSTPGRPKVLYEGVLPNQTHERAQGYRVFAETLVTHVIELAEDPAADLYRMGTEWGRQLTRLPDEPVTEDEALGRLGAKLDALWFAPEMAAQPGGGTVVVLHHYPFVTAAHVGPDAVCAVYRGMMDGILTALGSGHRVAAISAEPDEHRYVAVLERDDAAAPAGRPGDDRPTDG